MSLEIFDLFVEFIAQTAANLQSHYGPYSSLACVTDDMSRSTLTTSTNTILQSSAVPPSPLRKIILTLLQEHERYVGDGVKSCVLLLREWLQRVQYQMERKRIRVGELHSGLLTLQHLIGNCTRQSNVTTRWNEDG
eukprot:PhF_6_TR40394/c0_g1_i2/m.60178